ncbi:MAG: SgcJ/EcaC family oxidoreductase [Planctomycetota bacterium]
MFLRSLSIMFCILVACCIPAPAAESEQVALQKIVTDSADRYAKAVADQNAKAVAEMFTTEAEYVDSDGVVFHGREAIEAEYSAMFATAPVGSVDVDLISIRPIAPGIMTEEGVSTFTPKDQGTSSRTRYTATHVKQADGKWLLASVRELDAPTVTTHDRLKDLAWLEGKWHEDSDGEVVSTEWTWSKDGNFLLSKFTIKGVNDLSVTGTHRIGWDAERKQFRSWIFDSEGGFAEGCWTHDEDSSWSVQLSGIDSDGVRLSGRLNYSRSDADALVISENQRSRAGVGLPGFSRRVVRQPPPAAQKPAVVKP